MSDRYIEAFEKGNGALFILGDIPEYQCINATWRVHSPGDVLDRIGRWAQESGRSREGAAFIEEALHKLVGRNEEEKAVEVLYHYFCMPSPRLPANIEEIASTLAEWVRKKRPELTLKLLVASEHSPRLQVAVERTYGGSLEELMRKVVFENPENAHLRLAIQMLALSGVSPIINRLRAQVD